MKKLLFVILLTTIFTSCDCRFRYERGDVTKYKLYANKVLILDTFTKHNEPYYKVEVVDCDECNEASDLELE